ncbi:GNAT family N-acetyltransferase [Palleronia caenipelagi]|uniref:N-acetyltransferase family protein n=1 Tax=Palleronia caenipelagi TaxID=2489174 RepID=A0A547Q8W9_9RHOB|nr:GNAT family N-acetyltransferase [Palleronia caenipelagi]TRD22804.1 N-acetyltransferase family protein [Palleronia caenipelagi]
MADSLRLREAVAEDFGQITQIYGHHVLNGLATFETVPPEVEEMRARHARVTEAGMPYLVAMRAHRILGYAYAGPYRPRVAYRYTVEDSIYLAPGAEGQGIGSRLLSALIDTCEAGPWRQMIAVIGHSGNAASIALHRRHGFVHVGTFENVGYKHGRWVDSVLMQRSLGPCVEAPP